MGPSDIVFVRMQTVHGFGRSRASEAAKAPPADRQTDKRRETMEGVEVEMEREP